MTTLLTGATGTIGSVVLKTLLREETEPVCLLLRAGSQEEAHSRARALLLSVVADGASGAAESAGSAAERPCGVVEGSGRIVEDWLASGRVMAFAGDIGKPNLGLTTPDYKSLASRVTHIIHSAANLRMNLELAVAKKEALTGTLSLLALARDCAKLSRLRKVDLVSTVGVAGRSAGLVKEKPMPSNGLFRNSYEAAKAAAEAVALEALVLEDLPITIHRPSMVIGDSSTGRISNFQIFYYLCEFLSGTWTEGVIPEAAGMTLDTVTVDYVANALHWSSRSPATIGRIFHLCSGPKFATPLSRLALDSHAAFSRHGRKLSPLQPCNLESFRGFLSDYLKKASPATVTALKPVPYLLAYFEEPQLFDNAVAREVFESQGMKPAPLSLTVGKVFEYFFSQMKSQARPSVNSDHERVDCV